MPDFKANNEQSRAVSVDSHNLLWKNVKKTFVTCVLQLHPSFRLVPEAVCVVHHGEAEVGQKLGPPSLVADPATRNET